MLQSSFSHLPNSKYVLQSSFRRLPNSKYVLQSSCGRLPNSKYVLQSLAELLAEDNLFGESGSPEAVAAVILRAVDTDADARISLSEFSHGARSDFLTNMVLQRLLKAITEPFTSYMDNVKIVPRRISRTSLGPSHRRASQNSVGSSNRRNSRHSSESASDHRDSHQNVTPVSTQPTDTVLMETAAPRRLVRPPMGTEAPRRIRHTCPTEPEGGGRRTPDLRTDPEGGGRRTPDLRTDPEGGGHRTPDLRTDPEGGGHRTPDLRTDPEGGGHRTPDLRTDPEGGGHHTPDLWTDPEGGGRRTPDPSGVSESIHTWL